MLELYILSNCPYCKKVMDFMDENGIEYSKNDISDDVNNSNLIAIGGKEQVPFLYNTETNKGLYESDEIIEYIKTERINSDE